MNWALFVMAPEVGRELAAVVVGPTGTRNVGLPLLVLSLLFPPPWAGLCVGWGNDEKPVPVPMAVPGRGPVVPLVCGKKGPLPHLKPTQTTELEEAGGLGTGTLGLPPGLTVVGTVTIVVNVEFW
jgi:hypothetical protein